MKLSKTSAQAALAITYLATHKGDGMIQARQVAKHLRIPTDSVLKILQALTQHGLIESRLGRSGGYRFNRLPDEVTLLQVIEAIDGPVIAEVPSLNAADNLAHRLEVLKSVCELVADQIRAQLQTTTIVDLLRCAEIEVLRQDG